MEMRYEVDIYPERDEMLEALKTVQDLRVAILAVVPALTPREELNH